MSAVKAMGVQFPTLTFYFGKCDAYLLLEGMGSPANCAVSRLGGADDSYQANGRRWESSFPFHADGVANRRRRMERRYFPIRIEPTFGPAAPQARRRALLGCGIRSGRGAL